MKYVVQSAQTPAGQIVVIEPLVAANDDAAAASGALASSPRHGGVVVALRRLRCELVVHEDDLRLYLDGLDQPADHLEGASAVLSWDGLHGRQRVPLAPQGDHLHLAGAFHFEAATTITALITLASRQLLIVEFDLSSHQGAALT
ncbi:MAG: hypothetical protein V4532_07270 [Pseudomonadota bacterium]|uniref:hypothetical protein n=1 Tax=Aquabacterium sp. CECT 9606 TaxID=2845822 RepID=UPI001E470331|nr:hypothetical protein [Aquabacterium sp. CECT 9606]CAH0353399.1 hypothetical protein AQB9606_03211 [Aquabacterium sp. CECT 9606]